jgi:MFS family permease
MWASGALWNVTRWMTIFLGSYLVNQLTGSPLAVQLAGTCFFLPMFLGGMVAGAVSDRFDRRRTILRQLIGLAPLAALMALAVGTGLIRVWMLYVFAVAVGLGQVVDMTTRRALVNDLVGDRLFGNAMALEALSMAAGNSLGSLTGGAVIGALGESAAYGVVAGFYLICFTLMVSVPHIARRGRPGATAPSDGASADALREMRRDLAAGLRTLPSNKPFVSLLGVTAIVNFLFFSFMPMVPVLAKRFEVGPLLTGVLASGLGLGMLIGSLLMVVLEPGRRGVIYVGGALLAMVLLVVFAVLQVFVLALVALVLTGVCSAGFASVQTALVMSVNAPEMRGRAMGVLSMAIGTLPFGMVLLGALAERIGSHAAVVASAVAGMVVLIGWLVRRPEVLRLA